jgi:small-conductance mechanosensitive channel
MRHRIRQPTTSAGLPRRLTVGALVLAALVLCLPFGALAQEERVTVRLDGRAVIRVGPTVDADADTRARRIESRLELLLENPAAITPARTEPSGPDGAERAISVAGVTVVTITEADAEENLLRIDELAAQWASAIDQALSAARDARTTPWGRFSSEVAGTVRGVFARLGESTIVVIPRVLSAILLIAVFWLAAAGVRLALRLIFARLISDLTVENLIKQVAYYAVWLLGLFLAADALGFEPGAVAAGLGLGTLVLGFALKDVLSNFVSGLLILFTRPFRIGDQIVIDETEGTVERILLRATQIRTYDGRHVLVPNAEVFTSRITNNTAAPVRRATVTVHLPYDVDLERAAEACVTAAAAAEGVLPHPPPSILLADLGPEDITADVRFWADSRRSDFVATRARVRSGVIGALRRAGIDLPDPDTRRLRVELAREDQRSFDG